MSEPHNEPSMEQHEGPYFVELLYAESPSIPKPRLFAALQQRCPGITPLDRDPDSDFLAFVHTRHRVSYQDGQLPAQCVVAESDKPPNVSAIDDSVKQSWRFPEAASVVERAKVSVLVSDFMASGLPYRERLDLFQQVVAGVIEVAEPLAIHWGPTQQIVAPRSFLKALGDASVHPFARPGAMNVRFFRISGYNDAEDDACQDLLMDTLGLSALGLPDLQCHFRQLEPNDVSQVLYNTAIYLFDHGAVIESGHTIAGIQPHDKWRCRYEESLWHPHRDILDVDPGAPYSAGARPA